MPINALSRMVTRLDGEINEAKRSLPFISKRLAMLIERGDYDAALKCSKAQTSKLIRLTKHATWRDQLQARVDAGEK